ncbi:MAG: nucleoside-triphosphatase [Candidatus Eisenbacteria bacterium]
MCGDQLAELLAGLIDRRRGIVFVTGGSGAGKSSACIAAARILRRCSLRVGGVVAPRLLVAGETIGYDVVDVRSGERRELARHRPPGTAVGRFFMRAGGQAFADQALEHAARSARIVFVDEVGPWELQGGGLAGPLRRLLSRPRILVLVVRSGLVGRAGRVFAVPAERVWEVRVCPGPGTPRPAGNVAPMIRAGAEAIQGGGTPR